MHWPAPLYCPNVARQPPLWRTLPVQRPNLDWYAGWAEDIEEFNVAGTSREAIEAYLQPQLPALRDITRDELAAALGGLVDVVDGGAVTSELPDVRAAMFRRALSAGVAVGAMTRACS